MRRRWKTWAFTLVCLSCLLVFWYFYAHLEDIGTIVKCSNEEHKHYLRELCQKYEDGLVTGSLCKSLCEEAVIAYQDCLSHRTEYFVMLARWNRTLVVLKADVNVITHSPPAFPSYDKEGYREDPMGQLKLIVEQEFLGKEVTDVMQFLLSECDVGGDKLLSNQEMQHCWNLGTEREFVLLAALHEASAMPRLLGVCGSMYAVEYASSVPFTSPGLMVWEVRGWSFRAKLAMALIEMVESLEETAYGTLYLCDVMESNFGIVEGNGKYIIRAIDNGESYFNQTMPKALQYYYLHDCINNSDCRHLGCQLQCDLPSGKCLHKITSSNLQVICRKLLHKRKQDRNMPRQGLLDNPPPDVRKELTELLEECIYPSEPSAHSQLQLADKIKRVLARTIQ